MNDESNALDLDDIPACDFCGAMAGACVAYPNCPNGPLRFYVQHGVVHDGKTGKHVRPHSEGPDHEDGAKECCDLLNSMVAQIEFLTREKDEIVNQAISTWRRDNELLRAELDAAKVDAERLDWFEQQADEGCCPALLNDDNGHWAVSFDGFQNVPMQDEPEDIQTSFLVEAKDWHATAREAIDTARSRDETGEKIG